MHSCPKLANFVQIKNKSTIILNPDKELTVILMAILQFKLMVHKNCSEFIRVVEIRVEVEIVVLIESIEEKAEKVVVLFVHN